MVKVWDFLFYPDYYGLVQAMYDIPEYVRTEPIHPDGWLAEVRTYCELNWKDIQIICILAVVWSIFRELLIRCIFVPLSNYAQLTEANVKKMPESAWRATFYIISWSFIAYVIVGSHFELFTDPPSVFKGWAPGMKVPSDIYAAYAIQGSFYLHCMFATIFLDVWRSDSALLCCHHVLTLSLIGFSYAARYHNIGILVIFCHDVNDICLECAKVFIYLKVRAGKFYPVCEFMANIFFSLFALGWLMCRMYWFPLKVLYSILPSTAKVYYQDHLPFGIEFNVLLWLLMAMDVYWFSLILVFLFKIIIGDTKEMDDPREETDESSLKVGIDRKRLSVNGHEEETIPVQNSNGVLTPGKAMNGDGVKHRQPHQQNNSHEVPNHN
ncbi:ceramide synthase 1-like [Amphiura filiformis]|uniref:ceramide synthase 1-like n=1 Tax=Amphiura filiformis TaxID=82378 RepID=UPI003B210414